MKYLLREKLRKGKFHSRFGGTWLDLPDAHQQVDKKMQRGHIDHEMAQQLHQFIQDGFVIIPSAVNSTAIDRYLAELKHQAQNPNRLKASISVEGREGERIVPLTTEVLALPSIKILDTYMHAPSALPLIFAERIQEFMRIVFEDDPLAFQALHFETGSTQVMHQDTAYVVLDEPMKLCASWIALEDIQPGSGELRYYRGSHRLPDWVYSNQYKYFNFDRDGHDAHLTYLGWLDSESAKRGFDEQRFLPRKGDALIWAADLAHGGSPIEDHSLTRRSLVTHYTNRRNTPNYFHFQNKDQRKKLRYQTHTYYSSMHYPD